MRGVPRLALFAGALAIAALILFMLPAIIGIGGGGSSSSASPSGSHPAATRSAAPTVVAAPTPVVYVIKKGDTLSKVANKFGVELDDAARGEPRHQGPEQDLARPGDRHPDGCAPIDRGHRQAVGLDRSGVIRARRRALTSR